MEIANFNDIIGELKQNIVKMEENRKNSQCLPVYIRESIEVLKELLRITRAEHSESVFEGTGVVDVFEKLSPEEEKKQIELQLKLKKEARQGVEKANKEQDQYFEKDPETPAVEMETCFPEKNLKVGPYSLPERGSVGAGDSGGTK